MSYFGAAKARPDAVGRNADADDDADSTFGKDIPALPAVEWSGDASTGADVLIVGGCGPSSAFLDALFPSDAHASVASYGKINVKRIGAGAIGGKTVLVALSSGELGDDVASSLALGLVTALSPKRVVVLATMKDGGASASDAARPPVFTAVTQSTPEADRFPSLPVLPPPHLATGFPAGVMSACVCVGIPAQLIVGVTGIVVPPELCTAFTSALASIVDAAALSARQDAVRAAMKRVNQRNARLAATLFM